jgi:hypothetical protein
VTNLTSRDWPRANRFLDVIAILDIMAMESGRPPLHARRGSLPTQGLQ